MKKLQVFLSYCHDDTEEVSQIRSKLLSVGIEVWWDQDILPGQDWKLEIKKAMKVSCAVVVCISSKLMQRNNSGVYPEISDALDVYRTLKPGSIYLIPLKLDKCEMPHIAIDSTRNFDSLQYLRYFPGLNKEEQFNIIVKAINAACNSQEQTDNSKKK